MTSVLNCLDNTESFLFDAIAEMAEGERIYHWGALDETSPPTGWPLEKGRWIISSSLPLDKLELPTTMCLHALIPLFGATDKTAAAVHAVLYGWQVQEMMSSSSLYGLNPRLMQGNDSPEEQIEDTDSKPLTHQEQKILEQIAIGKPNKAIALELGISESTVKFHLQSLFRKLQAQNRAQVISKAFSRGLLII